MGLEVHKCTLMQHTFVVALDQGLRGLHGIPELTKKFRNVKSEVDLASKGLPRDSQMVPEATPG